MRILYSALLAVILALVPFTCFAAGTEHKPADSGETLSGEIVEISKTKKLFQSIDKESGIHMKYSVHTETGEEEHDVYKKGDSLYEDVLSEGNHTTTIISGSAVYLLNPQGKSGLKTEVRGEEKAQIDTAMSSIDSTWETAASAGEYSTGDITIENKKYVTEEFSDGAKTVKFVFNDDGSLAWLLSINGEQVTQLRISALEGNVKDEKFAVPADYQITEITAE